MLLSHFTRASRVKAFWPLSRRGLSSGSDLAFVFDIDGVLMRGAKPIPEASKSLELLNEHKVPFILLTNGGGVSEKSRVDFLSSQLKVPLSPLQIVQSHTPMRVWAEGGNYHRVLVVGGNDDKARYVAQDYGFKDVVVPMDIVKADPSVSPHHRYTERQLAEMARDVDLSKPFDAILVFNDPRDMGTDLQIVLDLLNSKNGLVGTKRPATERSAKPAVPIAFSNNDFVWANDYVLPRFGQGAFRMVVERLYAEMNALQDRDTLESTILGKPFPVQHDYAHWVLIEWNKIIHGHKSHGFIPALHAKPESSPFKNIYMVGDNPESDIAGANACGWNSILLRTGVFKDEDWEITVHKPNVGLFDNVLDSVKYVLENRKL
ncbi:TIGR01456 family HAD hydrolase [Candidozyma auris]|uniref:TIGR01456_family_HAD_hydrolase n=1 Tax=Candidozyma auris TaxID=498019 RepID=UPI000C429E65|nr:TIGR01456_family_HAD_hydrolase [[Candida] auris]PIS55376.1 TIGR01456 family HAD hydrolase [[Candida] auris]PSK74688.1 TIGR01456 family HAD hydrolase [[Candida] auris]QEO24161.1 TIGR01456_family_HAD_hydrolase [[Candida] auris]GBL52597.1 putative HAD hydrolase [[Candida] auris]